ncbi:G-protein coupled receptor mth [Plakobranchus ocellatus]|uniref:G-protein coupled receptor mth n=1 Tax=Plakobranchus ocellatus TaxID=259542 RepID=A0AAV3Y294_9GAST|nr:G-protein coupled receptor mth [Plakobranchus ocellatus]
MTTQQGSNAAALPENFYRYYLTIHGEIKLIYFKACFSTFGITKSRLERIQKNLTPTELIVILFCTGVSLQIEEVRHAPEVFNSSSDTDIFLQLPPNATLNAEPSPCCAQNLSKTPCEVELSELLNFNLSDILETYDSKSELDNISMSFDRQGSCLFVNTSRLFRKILCSEFAIGETRNCLDGLEDIQNTSSETEKTLHNSQNNVSSDGIPINKNVSGTTNSGQEKAEITQMDNKEPNFTSKRSGNKESQTNVFFDAVVDGFTQNVTPIYDSSVESDVDLVRQGQTTTYSTNIFLNLNKTRELFDAEQKDRNDPVTSIELRLGVDNRDEGSEDDNFAESYNANNRTANNEATPENEVTFMFGGLPVTGCAGAMLCLDACKSRTEVNSDLSTTVVFHAGENSEAQPLSRAKRSSSFKQSERESKSLVSNFPPKQKDLLRKKHTNSNWYLDGFTSKNNWPVHTKQKEDFQDAYHFKSDNRIDKHIMTRRRRDIGPQQVPREFFSSSEQTIFTCKCDSDCVAYGDCCVDALTVCLKLLEKDDGTLESTLQSLKEINHTNYFHRSKPINEAIEEHGKKNPDVIFKSYLITFGSCVKTDSIEGVHAISQCPVDFIDVNITEACQSENLPLLPLVSTPISPAVSITFKNVYCAVCHGVDENSLIAWQPSVLCKPSTALPEADSGDARLDYVTDYIRNGHCHTHFDKPESVSSVRTCQSGYDLTERVRTDIMNAAAERRCTASQALLCMSYVIPFDGFRNPHCQYCLRSPNITGDESASVRNRREAESVCDSKQQDWAEINSNFQGGILLLLDVTGRYSQYSNGDSTLPDREVYLCKTNQVYDSLVQKCYDLLCPYGFEAYRGECVAIESGAVYVPASSQLFPDPFSAISISISRSFSTDIKKMDCVNLLFLARMKGEKSLTITVEALTINRYQGAIMPRDQKDEVDEIYISKISCSEKFILSTQKEEFEKIDISLRVHHWDYEQLLSDLDFFTSSFIEMFPFDNVTITMTNVKDINNIRCPEDGVVTEMDQFSFQENKDMIYAMVNTTDNISLYYPLNSIGLKKITSWFQGKEKSENGRWSILICGKHFFFSQENCSVISYWRNETKTIANDTKLQIIESGRIFSKEQFDILGDRVLVCSGLDFGDYLKPWGSSNEDKVYELLNWICSCISIFFLAIMLLLYWEFPELLTLPGRLTACLAATMLLTFAFNLLTLIDLHHSLLCPMVAVIAHFVTLAHYGWMSAIAVNMALTFGSSSVRNKSSVEAKETFLRYNIVVWGISAIIVGVSLTLDLTQDDNHSLSSESQTASTVHFASSLEEHHIANESFTEGPTLPGESALNNNSFDNTDEVTSNFISTSGSTSMEFPRYGYPFCSWFSGPLWTRLAFVLIPYAVSLVVDIIGFAATIRGIILASRTSSKTLDKGVQHRTQCIIFLKLSTAMGFSWCLSVFFTVSESRALVYVYVTLVLLQGLLLFLAFMVNKRVTHLLRKRLSCLTRMLKVKSQTTKLSDLSSSNYT